MKSATCNLHLSDCTLENKSENSETGGRNASEGCLRQVETVAGLGNWQGKEMNSGRIQETGKETWSLTIQGLERQESRTLALLQTQGTVLWAHLRLPHGRPHKPEQK